MVSRATAGFSGMCHTRTLQLDISLSQGICVLMFDFITKSNLSVVVTVSKPVSYARLVSPYTVVHVFGSHFSAKL
jgi:hypothetical protein